MNITQVFASIRGGVFVNEASEQLKELVERIQASGKKGKITVELSIAPSGANNRMMTLTPKLIVKAPAKPETEESSTFFAHRGDLLRDDPDQKKLPLDERRDEKANGASPAENRAFGT